MKKVILIVEDDPKSVKLFRGILQASGFKAIEATNGRQGVAIANVQKPDLILMDIQMSVMDGYEVCKKLKADEKTKHIPIIMLTASRAEKENRVKGLKLGADAFLTKPIEESELTAQIRVALRIKKSEDLLRKEKVLLEDMVLERTKELSDSEKRFRLAFENANDGVALVSADGRSGSS